MLKAGATFSGYRHHLEADASSPAVTSAARPTVTPPGSSPAQPRHRVKTRVPMPERSVVSDGVRLCRLLDHLDDLTTDEFVA